MALLRGSLDIRLGFSGGQVCSYTFTKLKGVVRGVQLQSGMKLEVDFEKQKLKLNKAFSGAVCPKTAKLTLPLNYQLGPENNVIFMKIS